MAKELTEKQHKFAQGKAMGLGNTDAAIAAGYSPAGAAVQATQLMKLPHVKAAIAAFKKGLSKAEKKQAKEKEEEREPGVMKDHYDNPLELMLDVMNNKNMPVSIRFESAKQALPYCHARVGDGGKKAKQKERADELSKGGTRSPMQPPKPRNYSVQ